MLNWRPLFATQPSSRSWIEILRLCVPVLLPLVGFAIAGRFIDGALVGLGAYIVLFGAHQPARHRLLTYLTAALGMLGAVALGAATAASFWGEYLAYACVAVLAVVGSLLYDPGPPGAYFFVLMVGGGALLGSAGLSLAGILPMLAVGNLVAMVFGMVDLLWRDPVAQGGDIPPRPSAAWRLRALLTVPSAALLTLARVVIGILLALAVMRWTGDRHPFWAVLVTVLVLSWPGDPAQLRLRAVQRLVGTTMGILVFLIASNFPLARPAYVAVLCVVFLAMARVADRNYALASVFISLFALLLTVPLSASEPPLAMAASRLVDTALAAVIALALIHLLGPGLAGRCALASA
ncbi:MAG: FUSC family protein, partial [Burkholderiales bacterium]